MKELRVKRLVLEDDQGRKKIELEAHSTEALGGWPGPEGPRITLYNAEGKAQVILAVDNYDAPSRDYPGQIGAGRAATLSLYGSLGPGGSTGTQVTIHVSESGSVLTMFDKAGKAQFQKDSRVHRGLKGFLEDLSR